MHAIAEPCPSCGGFTIRPSRWRAHDFTFLLHLLRPLRCRRCGDRFYTPIFARSEDRPDTAENELVVRIRVKNPGRTLRVLLSWVSDPSPQSD